MKTLFSSTPRRTAISGRRSWRPLRETARNRRPTFSHVVLIAILSLSSIQGAETNAKQQLQEGLFEEEVNRDLKSAMKHYQSLLQSYDANRKFAATAVLRLGECFRKLGRTNDAVLQFSRVTREFSEQSNLVATATSRLEQLGISTSAPAQESLSGLTGLNRMFAEIEKLSAERAEIEVKDDFLREWTGYESLRSIETTLKDPVLSNLFARIRILVPDHDSLVRRDMSLEEQDQSEETLKKRLGEVKFKELQSLSNQYTLRMAYLTEWVDLREVFLDSKLRAYEDLLPLLTKNVQAAELISLSRESILSELPEIAGKLAVIEDSDLDSIDSLAPTLQDAELSRLVKRWTNLLTLPQRRLVADPQEDKLRKQIGDRRYAEAEAISKQMDARIQALTAQLMTRQRQLQKTFSTSPLSTAQTAISTEQKEIDALARLLESSPDLLNAPYKQSRTTLEYAVTNDYLIMVDFLLKQGARMDIKNAQGHTPLTLAVAGGKLQLTKTLLNAGGSRDTNALNESLYWAAASGYPQLTKHLLNSGANPNANIHIPTPPAKPDPEANEFQRRLAQIMANSRRHSTALVGAMYNGHYDIMKLLLNSGADPDFVDISGSPPLLRCIESSLDRPPIIRLLVEHGAKMDTLINTPADASSALSQITRMPATLANARTVSPRQQSVLHIASRRSDLMVLNELLNLGANVNVRDSNGATPLLVALLNQQVAAARALLEHGADPRLTGHSEKQASSLTGKQISPLSALLVDEKLSATALASLARQLLQRGADPNMALPEQNYGKTPLIHSIYKKRIDIAELLVKHGAKPDGTKENPSKSALNLAVAGRYHSLTKALIEAGADVNRISHGNFPLKEALTQVDTHSVDLLLKAGADPNLIGEEFGFSCLDNIEREQPEYIKSIGEKYKPLEQIREKLLAAGANPIASHPKTITVVRRNPAAKWPILLQTNHVHSKFTLLELIALAFRNGDALGGFLFPFPDFDQVTVHRLTDGKYHPHSFNVNNLTTNLNTKDFPLQWGDVIEVPTRAHRVNATWKFDPVFRAALSKRLARKVTLRYNDASGSLDLRPLPPVRPVAPYTIVTISNAVLSIQDDLNAHKKLSPVHSCWLGGLTTKVADLMTWNDLSKVTVLRTNSSSAPETLTLDMGMERVVYANRSIPPTGMMNDSIGPYNGVWLQHGDIIEIPKGDPNKIRQRQSSGRSPSSGRRIPSRSSFSNRRPIISPPVRAPPLPQ